MSLEFLGCTTPEQDERLIKEMDKLKRYTTRTTCRCCESANMTPLFSLGEQHVNAFPKPCTRCFGGSCDPNCPNAKESSHGPEVPINLELCRECTLVQAKHTAPPELLYSGHYWYSSGRNQTMRDALADVARAVEQRVELEPGDVVLDIGSNDGTLLRSYGAKQLVKVGVEPASNMREHYGWEDSGSVYLMQDFWGRKGMDEDFLQCHGEAKAVTALGMLYDIEDPNQFVADVAKVLAPDGIFCAQLMCLKQTVLRRDVGNFCHEHLEFYSLKSLTSLLQRHGLELFDLEENDVNGGSYRLWIQHVNGPRKVEAVKIESSLLMEATLDRPETYQALYNRMDAARILIKRFVREQVGLGKRVWVYGASTKGNTMLQWWGLDSSLIEAAADRSPDKWGRVTVGTSIPIVNEEEFRRRMPHFAIMLPYSFKREMVAREEQWLRAGGKFLVPLPEPHLVGWNEEVTL